MTEREFWAALGVRDFHWKRVERFNDGTTLKGEDNSSLRRSMTILNCLADFLGDGLVPDLAWNTQLSLTQE